MSFCPKCGFELKEEVNFCPKCGTGLKETEEFEVPGWHERAKQVRENKESKDNG